MLFGSCSAAISALVVEPETPPAPVPAVCAPVAPSAAPVPVLSTTGASFVGVVEQPTSAVAIRAIKNRWSLRMVSPAWMGGAHGRVRGTRNSTESLPRQRPPGGLAHVDRWRDEPLLYAAVAGDRGQRPAPPCFVRVDDHLAVGGNAGALVPGPRGQHLHLARREIERRDLEAAILPVHEHDALAVGERTRRHVVAAVEGEPLDLARQEIRPLDLRR